ncbi:hypothetical protein AK812_SmicGene32928 [Symbiodinium microadriaticum]|uniref:Uncharacterized protein n=1 Tax=Symbiodinium microadriaticum TaxID=2951 RepID=A0A1Q9CSX6_SYMMI|nr:hypothetical protein AK812_SmicGene32928 [Symbiodinium microadriaticum]
MPDQTSNIDVAVKAETTTWSSQIALAVAETVQNGTQRDSWWRSEACFLVASHVLLFASANWFFAKLLYRDYEVKQRYIQLLFAVGLPFVAYVLDSKFACALVGAEPGNLCGIFLYV